MSEEVILGGAFFDNNMPKWATEETIKRLGLEFKKDRSVSKKQNDKMISILGKIVQTMNKTEKSDRDNKKTLSDISKQIKESIKTEKEILKEIKKSSKEASKTTTTTSTNTNSGSDDVADEVRENTHVLEKINRSLSTMINDMTRQMGGYSDSMEDIVKHQKRQMGDVTRKSASTGGSGTSRNIKASLDSFTEDLEKKKKYTRGARSRNTLSSEISPSKSRTKKFNGRLGAMITSIGAFIGGIKKLTKWIFTVLKKIPILGATITAASAAIGAAMDFTEIVTQSFDDYRKLIASGMNFTEEVVNGVRMDGIRIRKMMSEAGLTFQTGLTALSRNINMLNEIGIGDYFQTVSDVMGNAQEATAFMNRVMMSQDKIEEMTSMYLTNLKAIGDYERLNSKERNAGIRSFIRNTKMLSEITGQSMDAIAKLLEDSNSDARLKVMGAGMDGEQRKNLELSMQALAAEFGGTNTSTYKALLDAIVDPTGGGIMRTDIGGELQYLSNVLGGDSEFFNKFDSLTKDIKSGSIDGQEVALRLSEAFTSGMDDFKALSEEQRDGLLSRMDDKSPLYGIVAEFLDATKQNINDLNKVNDTVSRFGEETGDKGRTSRTAALENQMQNAQAQAEASVQYALSSMADSDASRSMLETVYKGMMVASDITEKAAYASVAGAHSLKEFLPTISNNLFRILGIMDDDQESRKDSAEKVMDMNVSEMSNAAKIGRKQIMNDLKGAGLSTELSEGNFHSGIGYNKNRNELKKLNLDIDSLKEQANSNNDMEVNQARETLAYLSSEGMKGVISKADRKKYRKALEESLEGMVQEQRDMFYLAIERSMRTGTGVNSLLGKLHENNEKNPAYNNDGNGKENRTRIQDTVSNASSEIEEEQVGRGVLRRTDTQSGHNDTPVQQNNTSPANTDRVIDRPDANVNITTDDVVSRKLDELMRYMSSGTDEQINQLRNINQSLKQNRNNGSVSS